MKKYFFSILILLFVYLINKHSLSSPMRRDIAVLNGYTDNDKTTYVDEKTSFIVSKCDDNNNPQKSLGFSNDGDNPLMENGLPYCSGTSKYSETCFTQYVGYQSGEYKIKICHIGNGYKNDNSCVVLSKNSTKDNFSTSDILTFGFDEDAYEGGYQFGTQDCPDNNVQLNSIGYGYLYEATSGNYKNLEDFMSKYCEPLALKYTSSACESESMCPCDIECRKNGFMPDYNSDIWKKATNKVKLCYKCHQKHRGILFLCEKVYRCIHYKRGEIYSQLVGVNRDKYKDLYGQGQYICGYYNNIKCGCSKLRLVGGPRHFLRIARTDDSLVSGCYGSNDDETLEKIKNSPQCNLFEEQLSVRQFYDARYIDESDTCPESHTAELGYDYRGSFFYPKIIIKAGKNERLIGFQYENIKNDPNYYFNTPITKGSLNNDKNIPAVSSIYFSNFYPVIFTIGSTYKVFEGDNKCSSKPTGYLYFVALRLEYNILTGMSQLVAYEIRPSKIKTDLYTNPSVKSDGSIYRFMTDRGVIDDFMYDKDKNINIVNYTLDDKYEKNDYKYLVFTRIGEIERPPLMYGYINDNYLSSPLSLSYDYNARLEDTDTNSNKVKITLNPSKLSAVSATDLTDEIKLPTISKTLNIRTINQTAYTEVSGELKYEGKPTNNRALLYMQAFTVDYSNSCSVLQNFTSSPSMDILNSPPESISQCSSYSSVSEKMACYTTLQLLDECNAYETCLNTDTSLNKCIEQKNPKLKFVTSNDKYLYDYKINKDWRAKPKICIVSGFTFAEHLGELPNTVKYGDFGDKRYDYLIGLKRQSDTLFPFVEGISITRLGGQKEHINVGYSQINNKYIVSIAPEYFDSTKTDYQKISIINRQLNYNYIFSLKEYRETNEPIWNNYFPECAGDKQYDCKDRVEVRMRKVDETLSELCTDGDGLFGSGAWTDLNPRDLGTDYDIYIPYRCQFIDFTLFGAGGAGMTTEDPTSCMNAYSVNGFTWVGFWSYFYIPLRNWDIKVAPKYDATGGGGGYLHGTLDLNKIKIFDGYLDTRIGSATIYTRHTTRGHKSGNQWCYSGTSNVLNTLTGFGPDSKWVSTGGSHNFWYLSLNSISDGEDRTGLVPEDTKKGNTEISFLNYNDIGALSDLDIMNIDDNINSYYHNINLLENENERLTNEINDLSVYSEYYADKNNCNTANNNYESAKAEYDNIALVKQEYQNKIDEKNNEIEQKNNEIEQKNEMIENINIEINKLDKNSSTYLIDLLNLQEEKAIIEGEITELNKEINVLIDEIEGNTDCGREKGNDSEEEFEYKSKNRCLNMKIEELNNYQYTLSLSEIDELRLNSVKICNDLNNNSKYNSINSITDEELDNKIEQLNNKIKDKNTNASNILLYKKEIDTLNKKKQSNSGAVKTSIAVAKHGGSPIDCRILGTDKCPTTYSEDIAAGNKYFQTRVNVPNLSKFAIQESVFAAGVGVFPLVAWVSYYNAERAANGDKALIKKKMTDVNIYEHWDLGFLSDNLCYGKTTENDNYNSNNGYTVGTYNYINNYLTGNNIENKGEGHISKCVKRESSCGMRGNKYNPNDEVLRNGTDSFTNTNAGSSGQSTDNINVRDKHNIYNYNISMGGAFIHRKSTGGGGEGKIILSLVNPKIRYKKDDISGAEYADLTQEGNKQFDLNGKTDDTCKVRCPPVYIRYTNKNFVFPNGESVELDLICEYAGIPESDMEVDNADKAITPKKCYIISDTINNTYGDKTKHYSLKGKIIRNNNYCPISKCVNGIYGFNDATTEKEKLKTQYDRTAMMCKYNSTGYEKNSDGTYKTYSSKYYSMLFDANIYASMPFRGITTGALSSNFLGASENIAVCADNTDDDYINDDFEFLEGWSLKCGNGFWQLPYKVDPRTTLYYKPTETITKYNDKNNALTGQEVEYYDSERDQHYITNNKPMWYTEWTINNNVYSIGSLKTTGIKQLDKFLGSGDNSTLTMKRFVLDVACPPINADLYDFDSGYSGNANWEAAPENSNVVSATSCAIGDRYSFSSKDQNGNAIMPTRRCMRNGMWGPVFNPCLVGCKAETDGYGNYWSLSKNDGSDNFEYVAGDVNKIKVFGYCSGGTYLNSQDYNIEGKEISRICNISTGAWEEAVKHDCGDQIICIKDVNSINNIYIPYFRKIKQSYSQYFTKVAEKNYDNDNAYSMENITEPDESLYLIFDNNRQFSNFGFEYYKIKTSLTGSYYVDIVNKILSTNDLITYSHYKDKNGNNLIDNSTSDNWYVLEVNNNYKPNAYTYMLSNTDNRNEFLNVYNWIKDITYEDRNYTGKWSLDRCNLSKKKSSILYSSKDGLSQELYKNSKLIVFIPLSIYIDTNIKRIAIFSPKKAMEYGISNGYSIIELNNLIRDDDNIVFRIPLTIPKDLRYTINGSISNDVNKLVYPNTYFDDYPMVVYNGESSQRVYNIVDKISNIDSWSKTNSKITQTKRNCNGKYIGYIKHNTMKHIMYTESPDSENVYFISAYCYNGYIFGYNGSNIKFSQDINKTISKKDSQTTGTTENCFFDGFNDELPKTIYTYITSKYNSFNEDNNLYPMHKNSYIAAMFIKYWKTQLEPDVGEQEYFRKNYNNISNSSYSKIASIYEEYEKGKNGKYYRILPRRVEWVSNTIENKEFYENPSIRDLIALDKDDPYCTSTACQDKIDISNNFNYLVDPDKMYQIGEICSDQI